MIIVSVTLTSSLLIYFWVMIVSHVNLVTLVSVRVSIMDLKMQWKEMLNTWLQSY